MTAIATLVTVVLGGPAACVQVLGVNVAQVVGWIGGIGGTRTSPSATAQPATAGPPTTDPGTATPSPSPSVTPSPTVTPSGTVAPPPPPPGTSPPTVAFTFDARSSVDQCDTLTGRGDAPKTGRVLIFVRYQRDTVWFYEQPVVFGPDHTWTSSRVVTGGDEDGGTQFVYAAVAVSDKTADTLSKITGSPYPAPSLPGTIIKQSDPITRTRDKGIC